MDIRALKYEADQTLQRGEYPLRRLVLLHTVLALGVSLLLAVVSYLLEHCVSGGGGLSGLRTQAALTTAQIVLQIAGVAVLPFWQAGLIFAAVSVVRDRAVENRSLLEGFRRFVPILTSSVMMCVQYVARAIISIYLSSMLITLVPIAALEQATGMIGVYVAVAVISVLVCGALVLPVVYHYRMVNYIIMDDQKVGGMKAMFLSRILMQNRRRKLLRLDLSFWWFYALELLLSVIPLGSGLLPMSDDAAYWMLQLVCVAGQVGLYYAARPKLEITYALCYEQFRQSVEPSPAPTQPQVHPWEE